MADLVWVQGVHSNPFRAPPPPPPPTFLDILWKWINLVSMGPNHFIFMGKLKIMTRACHASTCTCIYVSDIISVFRLLVCRLYMYMYVCLSVCLCMNIHVPVCTWVCVCVCVCACVHYVCMYVNRTYICMYSMCGSCISAVRPGSPPPPLTKYPWSAHGSPRLSIHPSIENCPLIN